jgi:uncharacterized protein (TIGR00255 family)
MLVSMTGFGRAAGKAAGQQVTVEIRTLNSKSFELSLRIPPLLKSYEYPLREMLAASIQRGKADILISFDGNESFKGIINSQLLKEYLKELKTICDTLQLKEQNLMQAALSIPGVLSGVQPELSGNDWKDICSIIQKALDDLNNYRQKEGRALEADLLKRIKLMNQQVKRVKQADPKRKAQLKSRLKANLAMYEDELSENRLEQELIFYFEKMDFTEELVRLKSHLDFFTETLAGKKSNGKKLGFILQEMNREINTLGAKANHAPIQKMVVEMKDELEKIKEQLLNVL